jgi:hypothetical protein
MQVLSGVATLFFCCCRVATFGSHDLALTTWVSGPRYLALTTDGHRLTVADTALEKKLGVQRRPQRTPYSQEESLQHLAVNHITGINASRGPIQTRHAATPD